MIYIVGPCAMESEDMVLPRADEVYKSVIKTNNPCCQIHWSILSQKYVNLINQVDWNTFKIKWTHPNKNKVL